MQIFKCLWVRFVCVFILQFLFVESIAQVPGIILQEPKDTLWKKQVEHGMPFDEDPSDDFLILRSQYVLSFDTSRNVANWVAWKIDDSSYGEIKRYKGNFLLDSFIPDSFYRVKHSDYTNSGYDRGHIVRSRERTFTVEDNRSTFYLTNVMPQTPDLNRGVWLDFERYCERLCLEQSKTLYVYAGGIFHTDSTLKGEGLVAIPDSCYKIILVLDNKQQLSDLDIQKAEIICVMMPNKDGVRNEQWQKYISTLERIEKSTNYRFFSSN